MFELVSLQAERTRLAQQVSSQGVELEETKARAALADSLELKSKNLENSNRHLAMQLRQKEEALSSQLAILDDLKTQM